MPIYLLKIQEGQKNECKNSLRFKKVKENRIANEILEICLWVRNSAARQIWLKTAFHGCQIPFSCWSHISCALLM